MSKEYRGLSSLSDKIGYLVLPILKKKKDNFLILNNLAKNWQEIIGEKFYQFCAPKKITFERGSKRDGTLYISAQTSAIAFFLEADCAYIIEKIAAYYGYKIIAKIKIEQNLRNNIKPKESLPQIIDNCSSANRELIRKQTDKIEDQALREVLIRLGLAVNANSTSN